jgi:L-threonylcarbamoyladenylate synthase
VIADLDGKVDVILAGPDCRVGIESTVVDMTVRPPQILRPGAILADDLAQTLGAPVELDPAISSKNITAAPRAPGMKYRHYAPKAEMVVIEGAPGPVRAEISRLKSLNERIGRRVGVMLFDEKTYTDAAHDFYAMLREMDESGADLILAGALAADEGLGFAVMNRMMKAAGHRIVRI